MSDLTAEQKQAIKEPLTYSEAAVTETQKVIDDWDAGEIIHTAELGGMGPGYEQAIVIATVEFARAILDARPTTFDDAENVCREAIKGINDGLGLSGAQFGAAAGTAIRACVWGWQTHIKMFPDDRQIMASREWPKAPTPVGT